MSRPLLITAIIVLTVFIGGGVAVWFLQRPHTAANKNKNTNSVVKNSNSAKNTNAANINRAQTTTGIAMVEARGDTPVDGPVVVNGVSLHFSSLTRAATFNHATAPAGQEFLVVYFDAVAVANVTAVIEGLNGHIEAVTGSDKVSLSELKVANTKIVGDRGYVKFVVNTGLIGWRLEISGGKTAQFVKLPI